MDMEPGIINVKQEVPGVGTMNQKVGFVSMLLSATGMGLVGTFGRLSTPVDPTTGSKYIIGDFLATGRMMVGILGFLLIIVILGKWSELRRIRVSPAIVGGGLAIGTSLALYVSATLMTTIANAVFLIYTGPLFATILARIFLKERVGLRNGIFFMLVFTGMLLTVGLVQLGGGSVVSFGLQFGAVEGLPRKPLGDLFGLGSGVFYGLALFFYRYRGDVPSEIRGFWNFVFGTVGASVVLALRIVFLDQTSSCCYDRKKLVVGDCLICGMWPGGYWFVGRGGKELESRGALHDRVLGVCHRTPARVPCVGRVAYLNQLDWWGPDRARRSGSCCL